jgi:hypothetical protein
LRFHVQLILPRDEWALTTYLPQSTNNSKEPVLLSASAAATSTSSAAAPIRTS